MKNKDLLLKIAERIDERKAEIIMIVVDDDKWACSVSEEMINGLIISAGLFPHSTPQLLTGTDFKSSKNDIDAITSRLYAGSQAILIGNRKNYSKSLILALSRRFEAFVHVFYFNEVSEKHSKIVRKNPCNDFERKVNNVFELADGDISTKDLLQGAIISLIHQSDSWEYTFRSSLINDTEIQYDERDILDLFNKLEDFNSDDDVDDDFIPDPIENNEEIIKLFNEYADKFCRYEPFFGNV